MKPVIEVKGLSKRYKLGEKRPSSLRELADQLWKKAAGRAEQASSSVLWALRDVDFEIKEGEIAGIVGANGAGKSTLLKILSRITEPTSGRAVIRGRISSLLEVGTGFHPELTGMENIYLNGAVLGMKKREIEKKLDQIVAFSEIEKFLDTPVKRYSSGMYVRLAFAVAAHLDPEILLVDEVLAVGDVAFQKKCLGKMGEVSERGRTVVFVSHNMGAVQTLTQKCFFFKQGRLEMTGPTPEVVQAYLKDAGVSQEEYAGPSLGRLSGEFSRDIEFLRFYWPQSKGSFIREDEPICFHVTLKANEEVSRFRISMTLFRADGVPAGSYFGPEELRLPKGEKGDFEFFWKDHHIAPGTYYCSFAVGQGNEKTGTRNFDLVNKVLNFEVVSQTPENLKAQWQLGWGSIRLPLPKITRMS